MKKTTRDLLGFDDRLLMLFGIPLVSFLVSAMMFTNGLEEHFIGNVTPCLSISLAYTAAFWVIFRQITIFFRRRYPDNKDAAKRLVYQIFLVLLTYFSIKTVIHFLLESYMIETLGLVKPPESAMLLASLTLTFLILAVYEGMYFYSRLKKLEIEKAELSKANIQSQLEGLKNQVNPHFLFNSLNTLTYIIPEDPKLGVRFVQKLAKVYRYILEIRDRKLICLSEELEFLKSYVFLLKERFGNNLNVKIDIPEDYMDNKVVPLSLQILIENVIKHNIISSLKPLHVEVFVEKDRLIIRNNLQRKNQVMNSTKLGLENIKNRYRFFSDEQVEVLATAEYFIVILPLIKMKEKVEV